MSNPFDKYFKNFGDVKASSSKDYVRPSRYIAKIEGVFMRENRRNEDIFVVEMTVEKILSVTEKTAEGHDNSPNPVGSTMSQVIKFTGAGADMALPDIKGFCMTAIPGFSEATDEEQKAAIGFITSEEQPLRGTVVEVDAAAILTKKARKDFTQVRYTRRLEEAELVELGLATEES